MTVDSSIALDFGACAADWDQTRIYANNILVLSGLDSDSTFAKQLEPGGYAQRGSTFTLHAAKADFAVSGLLLEQQVTVAFAGQESPVAMLWVLREENLNPDGSVQLVFEPVL